MKRQQNLELSADHVLQHLLVQRKVSNDPFEAAVLFFKLLQALHLRRHQTAVKLLPAIKCLLSNPCLPAKILNPSTFLGLPQYERDLSVRELRLLHRSSSFCSPIS